MPLNYQELWDRAPAQEVVSVDQLDPVLRATVMNGDGIFDHYQCRTPYCFAQIRGHQMLLLEKLEQGDQVRISSVLNASIGYGTGILGSWIGELGPVLTQAVQECPPTTDEFASPERQLLIQHVIEQVANHTRTDRHTWNITFTSTGTEAMDFALQLVTLEGFQLSSGVSSRASRRKIVAFHGAWHGWGMGPNQLLDRRQFTDGVPRLEGYQVDFLPFADLPALENYFATHGAEVCAVFAEGILGDGGVVPADSNWWTRLRALCTQHNARLVVDEILTGLRCGSFLASPSQAQPDVLTLGKALGMGIFPLSAVLWRSAALSPRAGIGVRTFNARPSQARVVCAGLELLARRDAFQASATLGGAFQEEVRTALAHYPAAFKAVRGQGYFFGIELADPLARAGRAMRDTLIRHGLLVEVESGTWGRKVPKESRHNETLRLTPPLSFGQTEFEQTLRILQTVGKKITENYERTLPHAA